MLQQQVMLLLQVLPVVACTSDPAYAAAAAGYCQVSAQSGEHVAAPAAAAGAHFLQVTVSPASSAAGWLDAVAVHAPAAGCYWLQRLLLPAAAACPATAGLQGFAGVAELVAAAAALLRLLPLQLQASVLLFQPLQSRLGCHSAETALTPNFPAVFIKIISWSMFMAVNVVCTLGCSHSVPAGHCMNSYSAALHYQLCHELVL
jgi:hypothetical protein